MGDFMIWKFLKQKRQSWVAGFLSLILFLSVLAVPLRAQAASKPIKAKAAVMIDQKTGQVLYAQNAQQLLPVASVTKILTLLVIEDDIAHHRLSWDQKIKIDHQVAKLSNDWHFSNVELDEGQSYTVKALVESMMIVSADGSAEALALASAGSTKAFNHKMQVMAKKAGVTDAKIYNMIGLSNGELGKYGIKGVDKNAENLFTATDMAKISAYLLNHYPDVTNITKQKFVNFKIAEGREYQMVNINAMLPQNGVAAKNGEMDGLKTGLTDKAGNCFVGSGTFSGRRVITVVLHANGEFNNQFTETQKMIDIVQKRSQPVAVNSINQLSKFVKHVKVAHGKDHHQVKVKIKPTVVWVPKTMVNQKHWPAKITLRQDIDSIAHRKVRAPIKKGERLGTVDLQLKGMPTMKLPIYATQSVAKQGLF